MLKELNREQQLILAGLVFIIIAGLGVILFRHYVSNGSSAILIDPLQAEVQVANQEAILVHVSGAVKKEGVYKLTYGDRVMDAIEMAGGETTLADLSSLNLAEMVKDGQKVVVPVKVVEVAGGVSGNPGIRESGTLSINAKVNLNSASEKELQNIPGVGPSTAKKIIDCRTTNGPFTKPEDLMKVKGIGKGKYEKMEDKIMI